jgi:hypothetical protein
MVESTFPSTRCVILDTKTRTNETQKEMLKVICLLITHRTFGTKYVKLYRHFIRIYPFFQKLTYYLLYSYYIHGRIFRIKDNIIQCQKSQPKEYEKLLTQGKSALCLGFIFRSLNSSISFDFQPVRSDKIVRKDVFITPR